MGILPSNPRPSWVPSSIQVALLYSQVLLLMVVPGILVFHYAWHDHHSYGLLVLTYFSGSPFFKHTTCTQAWAVQIQSTGEWYLNAKRIEPDQLSEILRTQIGARASCMVFFVVKSDARYAEAIHAIDLMERSPARGVLVTPAKKAVRSP